MKIRLPESYGSIKPQLNSYVASLVDRLNLDDSKPLTHTPIGFWGREKWNGKHRFFDYPVFRDGEKVLTIECSSNGMLGGYRKIYVHDESLFGSILKSVNEINGSYNLTFKVQQGD